MSEIYLAGGCFWGCEKFFSLLDGVRETKVGYANGKTENPSYEDVCKRDTGHAETVYINYDENVISLEFLLKMFFEIIDPTSVNKQGGDIGTQYRTGIYYVSDSDLNIINKSIEDLSKKYAEPIVIEVMPLANFYNAEEYHQQYLDKNPTGYCHIDRNKFERAKNIKVR